MNTDTAKHNAAAELAREVASTQAEVERLHRELDAAETALRTARELYNGAAAKLRTIDSALAAALRDTPVEQRLAILRSAGLGGFEPRP